MSKHASISIPIDRYLCGGQLRPRIIVFDECYNDFVELLKDKTLELKIGISNEDYYGPVINKKQLSNMLFQIELAKKSGAKIITGGNQIINKKCKFLQTQN